MTRNDRLARLMQSIPAEMKQFVFKADANDPRTPARQLDEAQQANPDRFAQMVILLPATFERG